jgi:hypothetical protein
LLGELALTLVQSLGFVLQFSVAAYIFLELAVGALQIFTFGEEGFACCIALLFDCVSGFEICLRNSLVFVLVEDNNIKVFQIQKRILKVLELFLAFNDFG